MPSKLNLQDTNHYVWFNLTPNPNQFIFCVLTYYLENGTWLTKRIDIEIDQSEKNLGLNKSHSTSILESYYTFYKNWNVWWTFHASYDKCCHSTHNFTNGLIHFFACAIRVYCIVLLHYYYHWYTRYCNLFLSGTGKTNMGIKLVCLFKEINERVKSEEEDKKQIVYCGPSNKSVDLVAGM